MSTATFGDVNTNADAPAEAAVAPGEQAPAIDPNDPRLTSESLTIDPEADAYAVPPPLPDGKWRAKAKQIDIKDPKTGQLHRYIAQEARRKDGSAWQTDANGKPAAFLCTNIEYSIIDHSGKNDGVKMTEYWVKTLVNPKKGTSPAATMIFKLGGKLPVGRSHKDIMDALLSALAAEPELVLETAWSAECQTCQEKAEKTGERAPRAILQGMHRFPVRKGEHDPVIQCPQCKGMVRAQARIVSPFSLAESNPTHGTGAAK
jgi:hypothetical protein